MAEATQYRIVLTLQPLTESGEDVGSAVKQEQVIAIAARATFDPKRRVIAARAMDLGDAAAPAFFASLTPLVTK